MVQVFATSHELTKPVGQATVVFACRTMDKNQIHEGFGVRV